VIEMRNALSVIFGDNLSTTATEAVASPDIHRSPDTSTTLMTAAVQTDSPIP
jgi:hypothetical protein|tara:strand:+ start:1973 stop:2128 length:156 start_codon:yes stop_codon:yes gene_type:complete